MFSMYSTIGLLVSIAKINALAQYGNTCGSMINSYNQTSDMAGLLSTGINCQIVPNYGASTGGLPSIGLPSNNSSYCLPGNGCGSPSNTYYPQSGSGITPQQQFPGMGGNSTDECEVTTTVNCQPKPGKPSGQNGNYSPSQQYWPSSNQTPGQQTPGYNQIGCDCSEQQGQQWPNNGMPNFNPTNYPGNNNSGNYNNGMCDCSNKPQNKPGSGNIGYSQQGSFGGIGLPQKPYSGGQNFSPMCQNGSAGQGNTSPFGPQAGSVLSGLPDCSSPSLLSPPINTVYLGMTELPVAPNFSHNVSSCGQSSQNCISS